MEDGTRQPTILVVEDDPSMLAIISFLLEDEGYKVVQATDGLAGLSALKDGLPDLIISDVMMPGMDGFDFYERLHARAEWNRIPFIFLTAKGQRTDVRRGMELGADDYLTKPFEPEELISAIEVRLARSAEAQAAISKASSDLSERIIQTLTHEFRTPLALVVGYTDLLESSGQNMAEEERQLILQGLQTGAQRLIGLVEDFLLLNKLESGALAAEIEREQRTADEPDWVVDLAVDGFREQAAGRNVAFVARLEAPGVSVLASRRDLTEIVRKLVDNAIKFSKSGGGEVIVGTRQEGDTWVLEVADEGIGIQEAALPWIFEAFRQVDRGTMEQQGAGVGLAIVRGLAEVYGGGVKVQSAPGKGSTFTCWLPLATSPGRSR
jgi:two-component system sensor histidine kinase/response regulator